MSSTNWREEAQKLLMKHYEARSKISKMAGLTGVRTLEANAREQQKNQEAESDWARRHLWGASGESSDGTIENKEMSGHTILGDFIASLPPQQTSNAAPWAAAAATLLGLGAMGTYIATRPTPPPPPVVAPAEQEPPSFDDESLSIGLGQIDDYQQPKVVE